MSEPTSPGMDAEAAAWRVENADDLPPSSPPPGPARAPNSPPPGAAQPPASLGAASKTDDDDDDDQPVTPEEAAEFAVTLIGICLTNLVSERLEFKPKQEKKLVRLAVPLAKKYLPETSDVVSPEVAFAVGLAVICGKNYLTSSPEPASEPASPPGGSENANGKSGGPSVTTPADIDGRKVEGQVLQ